MDFNCCANRDGFHIDSHISVSILRTYEIVYVSIKLPSSGDAVFCIAGDIGCNYIVSSC